MYLDVDYRLCITWIVHQQLWGYKVEEKVYPGVRERWRLNIIGLCHGLDEWIIAVRFSVGMEISNCITVSRLALGSTQPPVR
jgi:hypothetical protein